MSDEEAGLMVLPKENAVELWRRATDVAGAVREFVLKGVVKIGNGRHLRVEQWQAIANGFGYVPRSRVMKVDDLGVWAVADICRTDTGQAIGGAEGFVGTDEKTWSVKPLYARMGMAQTRAISRACRSAFAFVVPIIDAGLSTTPAEEMEGIEQERLPPPPPPRKPAAKVTVQPKEEEPFPSIELPPTHDAETGEVSGDDVDWAEYVRAGATKADRFRLMRDVPPALKHTVQKLLGEVR